MNALAIIQVVLVLLSAVTAAARANGLSTIVAACEAAIAELQKVHGTPVTKGQLDGLEVTPLW